MTVPDSSPTRPHSPPAPDDGVDGRIVRSELGIACATLVTATLTATAATPTVGWWPVPVVALGWALLTAAADRRPAGRFFLYAGGALAAIVVVSPVIIGGSLGAIPLVLFGLGVGSAANRLAFGVLFPVPPARRRRERAD